MFNFMDGLVTKIDDKQFKAIFLFSALVFVYATADKDLKKNHDTKIMKK